MIQIPSQIEPRESLFNELYINPLLVFIRSFCFSFILGWSIRGTAPLSHFIIFI